MEGGDEIHRSARWLAALTSRLQDIDLGYPRREMDPHPSGDLLDGAIQRFGVVGEEAHLAVVGLGADAQDDGRSRLEQVATAAK